MLRFMRNQIPAMLSIGLLTALVGCNDNEKKLAGASESSGGLWSLTFGSPTFRNGEAIPKKYTVDGENISPPLKWSAGPDKTREFVLIVEDPDVKAKEPFVHWVAYHIPATSRGLPEGAGSGTSATQGKNSKGLAGYVGPEPSPGKLNRYMFQLFAVDAPLEVDAAGADKAAVLRQMEGHVLAKGMYIGTYQRQ